MSRRSLPEKRDDVPGPRGQKRWVPWLLRPVPPEMDLDWLRRLDVHLRAWESTGEPLPLASLREEIDMAKFVCGIGPDPRNRP